MTKTEILMGAIEHLEGYDRPGTVPARLNNPGDLIFMHQHGATAHAITGTDGKVRVYAGFATKQAGLEALAAQIALDGRRGLSLAEFVHKWAPGSDGNNEHSYLAGVMKALGCTDQDQKLEAVLYEETSTG